MNLNMETINFQKIAVFPTNDEGRAQLHQFQQNNRIVSITGQDIVVDSKKEPAIWILFVPGLDPFMETTTQTQTDDVGHTKPGTKASNSKKSPK